MIKALATFAGQIYNVLYRSNEAFVPSDANEQLAVSSAGTAAGSTKGEILMPLTQTCPPAATQTITTIQPTTQTQATTQR
jgi:hypothetical protein